MAVRGRGFSLLERLTMLAGKNRMTVSELASLGGKARAKALTPEQRSQSARDAVNKRWVKWREKHEQMASNVGSGKTLVKSRKD